MLELLDKNREKIGEYLIFLLDTYLYINLWSVY